MEGWNGRSMRAKAAAKEATATLVKPALLQRLFTAKEAARYLGYPTPWPLRALAWKGEIPVVKLSKRRLAFDIYDLDRFVETHKETEKP